MEKKMEELKFEDVNNIDTNVLNTLGAYDAIIHKCNILYTSGKITKEEALCLALKIKFDQNEGLKKMIIDNYNYTIPVLLNERMR
jgi:uncharacterized protein involved in tolerance to divalent cations